MDDEEYRQEVDNAYRAIGRYIVSYSQLVEYMRLLMARRLTRGEKTPILGEIALGEHGHALIANAFFTMCRQVGRFDKGEQDVASRIRSRFIKINEARTDYAHGDWLVGAMYWDSTMDPGDRRVADPQVVRIRPRSSQPPQTTKDVPVTALDKQSDEILALLKQIVVFGKVCLEQPIMLANPPEGVSPILNAGDIRVRDVLVMRRGEVAPGPKWDWFQLPKAV